MPVNQCKSIEIDFVAEIKSYMILFVEENEYTWLKQKFYIQLVLSLTLIEKQWEKLIFVDFNDIYRFSRESNTYNVCGSINYDVINGMAFNK